MMKNTMENLYLPGSGSESLRADIARLKKRSNFHTGVIVILVLGLVALAVIYFLNIPVTPYQSGSKSLFGAGQNPNVPDAATASALNANLTKRLAAVEAELASLQSKVKADNAAMDAKFNQAQAIGRKSDSQAKRMNDTLNLSTGRLRSKLKDVEKTLFRRVQEVNDTVTRQDEKAKQGMEGLQQLIRRLQEEDGLLRDATNASLDALKRRQTRLEDELQATNDAVHKNLSQVQGQIADVESKVDANKNTSTEQRNEARRLQAEVNNVKKAVLDLEENSTKPHELAQLRDELLQYTNDASAHLNENLAAHKQRVDEVAHNATELAERLASNLTSLKDEAKTRAADNDRKIALFKDVVLNIVQNLNGSVNQNLGDLLTSFKGKHDNLNSSLLDILGAHKQSVDKVFGNMTELGDNMSTYIKNLQADAKAQAADNGRILALLEEKLRGLVQNINSSVYQNLQEIGNNAMGRHEALNTSVSERLDTIPERMRLFEDRLSRLAANVTQLTANNYITNINTQVVDAPPGGTPTNAEEILAAIQPKLDAINQAVETRLNQLAEATSRNLTKQMKTFETRVTDLEANMDEVLNQYDTQLTEEEPASFG